MTDLPDEIMVWRSMEKLTHIGTWATERYPEEAVAFVSRADAEAAMVAVVERAESHAKSTNCVWQRNLELIAERDTLAAANAALEAKLAELRAERDALKKKLISPDPYEDTAHPDDHAVNRFAAVMKGKLAAKRLQGRGGWQEPEVTNGYLSRMLREHVDKGDPVDVANLAMMIHQRGERIAPQNEGVSCKAIDDAIADRDRLSTANAVLEARVAGLQAYFDTLPDSGATAEQLDAICALAHGRTDQPLVVAALAASTPKMMDLIDFVGWARDAPSLHQVQQRAHKLLEKKDG